MRRLCPATRVQRSSPKLETSLPSNKDPAQPKRKRKKRKSTRSLLNVLFPEFHPRCHVISVLSACWHPDLWDHLLPRSPNLRILVSSQERFFCSWLALPCRLVICGNHLFREWLNFQSNWGRMVCSCTQVRGIGRYNCPGWSADWGR